MLALQRKHLISGHMGNLDTEAVVESPLVVARLLDAHDHGAVAVEDLCGHEGPPAESDGTGVPLAGGRR